VLHLEASRRRHVGTVAFRHTDAMIHVVAVALHLDVEDLHAQGRKCSDERIEDSALAR
jgi:hypothetical protein